MTGPSRFVMTTTVFLLLVWGLSGSARQDVRAPQIGRIDFMAVTKDGQPVGDLKPEEVVLRIDGKIRPLRTLNYVKMSDGLNAAAMAAATAGTSAAASGPSANTEIAPPFVMNLVPPVALSRSVILMVDDETMPIGEEQRLRATLTRFVRSLPEQDQVSLVTVPHGGVVVGLTADREKLAKGIATIAPLSPVEDPACRSKTMLSVLETTMNRLIAQRANDQPVVVALLSASLTGISTGELAPNPARGGGNLSAQAGPCALRADDFYKVGQAQANARVQFYVIHPDYSPANVLEGIENLRSQTGAPLLHLTSSGEPGLNRMARETSGYYIATFDTVPDEITGKPHQSKVTTTRKDVDVRDRPWLIVGKDQPSPTSSILRPEAGTGIVTTAYDMVRSGRPFRDLPLRGTAWPTRNNKIPTALDVIAAFEPLDPNTRIMQAAAALFDENGVAKAYWPPDPAQGALMTWPAVIGLTVNPGTYRLRIAVIDDKGHTGLIDQQLVAELQKAGPLQVGGLSFGVSRPNGFQTRLQFTTEAAAIAMFDLYGGVAGETKISAVFEVARTTDGPPMFNVNATASPTSEEGKFVVMGTIPVQSLAPGDYVIRGVVTVEGQGSARVIRTLRRN